ncbi:hypothetical protein QLQ12_12735 [Actinoplanes sp. NEAU-A12]|uniref:Uncharacterized protein n=1 Tax=Actinoplanes sandaracinus TaxID=3045177 RepID=A0ABT6WI99_9ACTN|nr:hypothetical protein [Actinoplanes sandaracinus]MDI6099461.1 hypothetical protein [Actinoplanes sandaracinus]
MTEPRFPGRWLGGVALVLGPLLMSTGVLLRAGRDFFFPEQLAAYAQHPALMLTAYSCFLAGNVLLWPAVAVLAQRIGATKPIIAVWGGALATFGLFARTFHAGVDHLAFQLVRVQDLPTATQAVADSYTAYHIISALSVAIMAGWIVLAVGAWRARVLGLPRAIALAAMSALPLGVLKGTTPLSIIAVAGLIVALIPLGARVLREGQTPRPRAVAGWCGAVLIAGAAMTILGMLG